MTRFLLIGVGQRLTFEATFLLFAKLDAAAEKAAYWFVAGGVGEGMGIVPIGIDFGDDFSQNGIVTV